MAACFASRPLAGLIVLTLVWPQSPHLGRSCVHRRSSTTREPGTAMTRIIRICLAQKMKQSLRMTLVWLAPRICSRDPCDILVRPLSRVLSAFCVERAYRTSDLPMGLKNDTGITVKLSHPSSDLQSYLGQKHGGVYVHQVMWSKSLNKRRVIARRR